MPPEMVVRLRLLGFKQEAIQHWMSDYGEANQSAWWQWLSLMENEPDTLASALCRYNAPDYP